MAALLRGVRAGRALRGLSSGKTGPDRLCGGGGGVVSGANPVNALCVCVCGLKWSKCQSDSSQKVIMEDRVRTT